MSRFDRALEMADSLDPTERESLISILQSRLRDQRRAELVDDVENSRKEFRDGQIRPATPAEIIQSMGGKVNGNVETDGSKVIARGGQIIHEVGTCRMGTEARSSN